MSLKEAVLEQSRAAFFVAIPTGHRAAGAVLTMTATI